MLHKGEAPKQPLIVYYQQAQRLAQCEPCGQCGEQDCPRRHNIERQEEVVAALWEFAANIQLRPDQGGTVATIASGQPNAGTKCGLDHVGKSLAKIMRAFNYGVLRVD
jgi:hypothetical protein